MSEPEKRKPGRPKGTPKTGGGSRLGIPNKSTAAAREAIARLVDGNVPRMQEWLDHIARTEGPLMAWKCMVDVIEYHVPKLARTEITGEGGGAVRIIASSHDEAL